MKNNKSIKNKKIKLITGIVILNMSIVISGAVVLKNTKIGKIVKDKIEKDIDDMEQEIIPESEIKLDNSIIIRPENEIKEELYETSKRAEEREKIIKEQKQERLEFYKNHQEYLEEDAKKGEIVLNNNCDTYKDLTSTLIENDIENKLYDVAYVQGIGNTLSNGKGEEILECDELGYTPCVIIYREKNHKYEYGVAKLEVDNSLGKFLGWYKDKDVYTRVDVYRTVVERPIVSKVIDTEKTTDGQWLHIGDTLDFFSNYSPFPYSVLALDNEGKYGLKVGFSEEEKENYETERWLPGLYIPNIYLKNDNENKRVKYDCDEELVQKKYKR